MTSNSTVASRIRHAREQSQLPAAELRRVLRRDHGIALSKTGLHRLETVDSTNPNLKLIQAIAEVTHVSPGWILFGDGASVPGDEVAAAIRSRVIDTIELMVGAIDMSARQKTSINNWLKSVRENVPKTVRKP